MFYLISKESVGSGIEMRELSESDYGGYTIGLSKMLSSDGMFVVSEDEFNIYLKGVK